MSTKPRVEVMPENDMVVMTMDQDTAKIILGGLGQVRFSALMTNAANTMAVIGLGCIDPPKEYLDDNTRRSSTLYRSIAVAFFDAYNIEDRPQTILDFARDRDMDRLMELEVGDDIRGF